MLMNLAFAACAPQADPSGSKTSYKVTAPRKYSDVVGRRSAVKDTTWPDSPKPPFDGSRSKTCAGAVTMGAISPANRAAGS